MRKPLYEHALSKYGISSISFSRKDPLRVLVNMMDSQIHFVDLQQGTYQKTFRDYTHTGNMSSQVSFSPKEEMLMVPTAVGSLAIFETEDSQLLCQIDIPGIEASKNPETGLSVIKICDFEWHAKTCRLVAIDNHGQMCIWI